MTHFFRHRCKLVSVPVLIVSALSLFVSVGCAHSPEHLREAVDAGKYKEAADATVGNPTAAATLAALILEQAAATNPHRFFALERLSVAGSWGLRSLERLAAGEDETARAARVALHRYDKPDAQAMASCVADGSADVRRMCAFVWHRFFAEGELKKLLLDADPTVRLYALKGLQALPADLRRAGIFADVLLRDPSSTVRMAAARRGDLLGDDALLLLKDRLHDDRIGMQIAAVTGIGTVRTAAARDLLSSIASGPLDEVALNAAAALAERGEPIGETRLAAALKDRRPAIRVAALYLLKQANLENASALTVHSLDDAAPEVVLAAANLLRTDVHHRDKVTDALHRILKMETTETRRAQNLLVLLGDASAEKQMAELFADPAALPEAESIAQLAALTGAAGLLDSVVPMLGDPREGIRIYSAVFVLFSMSKI